MKNSSSQLKILVCPVPLNSPSLFLSAQHLSGTAGEGLGTGAVVGVVDVGALEMGAERGFVKRFGTGGEGWCYELPLNPVFELRKNYINQNEAESVLLH